VHAALIVGRAGYLEAVVERDDLAVPSSRVSPSVRVAGSVSRIWGWAAASRTFCRGVSPTPLSRAMVISRCAREVAGAAVGQRVSGASPDEPGERNRHRP
jgi:hypothetical protein